MEEIKYYKIEPEEIVRKLKEYFSLQEDILVAILFGSALRRSIVRDIDVAIYPARGRLERTLRIGWELEKLLKTPVDVVPLKELPPKTRLKVLVEGKPVVIKSRAAYTELLKITISELEDMKTAYSKTFSTLP